MKRRRKMKWVSQADEVMARRNVKDAQHNLRHGIRGYSLMSIHNVEQRVKEAYENGIAEGKRRRTAEIKELLGIKDPPAGGYAWMPGFGPGYPGLR